MASMQAPGITLGTSMGTTLNSLGPAVYHSPYTMGITNVDINMQHDGINVTLTMRVEEAPRSIDDIPKIMANSYLKDKGIDMTLDEIIEKFLPEYTL